MMLQRSFLQQLKAASSSTSLSTSIAAAANRKSKNNLILTLSQHRIATTNNTTTTTSASITTTLSDHQDIEQCINAIQSLSIDTVNFNQQIQQPQLQSSYQYQQQQQQQQQQQSSQKNKRQHNKQNNEQTHDNQTPKSLILASGLAALFSSVKAAENDKDQAQSQNNNQNIQEVDEEEDGEDEDEEDEEHNQQRQQQEELSPLQSSGNFLENANMLKDIVEAPKRKYGQPTSLNSIPKPSKREKSRDKIVHPHLHVPSFRGLNGLARGILKHNPFSGLRYSTGKLLFRRKRKMLSLSISAMFSQPSRVDFTPSLRIGRRRHKKLASFVTRFAPTGDFSGRFKIRSRRSFLRGGFTSGGPRETYSITGGYWMPDCKLQQKIFLLRENMGLMFKTTYTQAISTNLAVGTTYYIHPESLESTLNIAARWRTPLETYSFRIVDRRGIEMSYVRKFKNLHRPIAAIATRLQYRFNSGRMKSAVGYTVYKRGTKIKGYLDSNGNVRSTISMRISRRFRCSVVSQLCLYSTNYTLGVSLSG